MILISWHFSSIFKVKSQTENYVNNTGKNLGAMEGHVEGLTDRVADVDSSLNYMVGQLSLVVQEFNQVLENKLRLKEFWRGIFIEQKPLKFEVISCFKFLG